MHPRRNAVVMGIFALIALEGCRGSESAAPDSKGTAGHFSLDVLPAPVGVRYTYEDLTGDGWRHAFHLTEAASPH